MVGKGLHPYMGEHAVVCRPPTSMTSCFVDGNADALSPNVSTTPVLVLLSDIAKVCILQTLFAKITNLHIANMLHIAVFAIMQYLKSFLLPTSS